jgi:hypothetical protein
LVSAGIGQPSLDELSNRCGARGSVGRPAANAEVAENRR